MLYNLILDIICVPVSLNSKGLGNARESRPRVKAMQPLCYCKLYELAPNMPKERDLSWSRDLS